MKPFNILLVDDHPLVTDGLTSALRATGFVRQVGTLPQIKAVHSVAGAVSLLDQAERFDLILLDISMPEQTGFDLLATIRQRAFKSLTMVLSASDDVTDMQRAYDLGANGFVRKFEPAEDMLKKILAVVNGEECFPEAFYDHLNDPSEQKRLTPRQSEVLQLMAAGYSNKRISSELRIAEATVKFHISEIFRLLQVHNRTLCVREAVRHGLIREDTETKTEQP